MIQTLGDVLLLVTIISVGVVSMLLAVFLYHLIFIVMDLKQVMKRLNDLTAELEELVRKPVEMMGMGIGWLSSLLADLAFTPKPHTEKKAKKHKKGKRDRG